MYKFGILGPGNIARKFAAACKEMREVELVGVASTNKERAEAFAKQYGGRAFGSYEELLEQDVDAIYISVVNNLHLKTVKQCLDKGKAVLCEKPAVRTLDEADELISYVRKKQVLFMEGMWTNFLPCIKKAKEWILEGKIGRVRNVQSSFSFCTPFQENSRLFSPALGGGGLLDVGIYGIAFSMEMANGKIKEMKSMMQMGESQVDEFGTCLLRFDNEIIASCNYGIRLSMPDDGFIYGEEGYIFVKKFWASRRCERYDSKGNLVEYFEDPIENGFRYEIEHFAHLLDEKKKESDVNSLEKTRNYYEAVSKIIENNKRGIGE